MADRVYGKIKADKIVRFIFNDAMKVNWDKHLAFCMYSGKMHFFTPLVIMVML